MNNNPFRNQIEIWDIYRQFPDRAIISDRDIFDFSIATTTGNKLVVVWSEYYPEKGNEVSIYSCCCDDRIYKKAVNLYKGNSISPYIKITNGKNCRVYLLLVSSHGALTELLLQTYDGTSWKPETKIIDIESATFGHNIIASKLRAKIYVIFGDYREWHTFPYILTAFFTGHMGKEFGKLFLVEGDGVSWSEPRRITKTGRFSASNPAICLDNEENILYVVWEDERRGYWKRTIFFDSFDGEKFSGNKRISGGISGTTLPLVACDNKSNVYVVWGTSDEDGVSKLYFRERINNSWGDIMEFAGEGVANSITTDTLGNVHFFWDDGSKIYYRIKSKSFWTKTVTFVGKKAKILIDDNNGVHLLLLMREKQRKYSLIYKKLEYNKISP